MTAPKKRRLVKLSLLEYDDKLVPIPLFNLSVGILVGFTAIFQFLVYLTIPIGVFVVYSIINGDITLVDVKDDTQKSYQEEE